MSRLLIVLGLAVALVGVLWPWVSKLGRLPGDLRIERPGGSFYFPITTSILISIVISLLMYLFRRK